MKRPPSIRCTRRGVRGRAVSAAVVCPQRPPRRPARRDHRVVRAPSPAGAGPCTDEPATRLIRSSRRKSTVTIELLQMSSAHSTIRAPSRSRACAPRLRPLRYVSGDRHDLAALLECAGGGDERAAPLAGLHDDDGSGEAADDSIPLRKVEGARWGARRILAEHGTLARDVVGERGVLARIHYVGSRPEDRDRPAVRRARRDGPPSRRHAPAR